MRKSFTLDQAIAEASRCLLCHDAPCTQSCPAGTQPHKFIRSLRFHNLKGAAATIKRNNPLGGICAVVCPTSELCQQACIATGIGDPVKIGEIQRFVVEWAWDNGFNPIQPVPSNGVKVAVVGSGPSGLTCAALLAQAGFLVTVFERLPKPGGMPANAIPEHRLSSKFLEREIADIEALGVEIKCNHPIETREQIDELFARGFAAVYLATGAWEPVPSGIPGANRVLQALPFLLQAKSDPKTLSRQVKGRTVVVIGGGDTAMDAAITALKLKAAQVFVLYRRTLAEMPASLEEKENALRAGVNFVTLVQPVEYHPDGVRLVRTRLGKPDSSGRRRPIVIPGTEHDFPANLIIEALGLAPTASIRGIAGLKISSSGAIITRDSVTSLPNVYAGGDAVNGASVVARAVADGAAAARKIISAYTPHQHDKSNLSVEVADTAPLQAASTKREPNLRVTFCGIEFENPILLSSSPVSNTAEMISRAFETGFGGVVYKTIGKGGVKIVHPSPRMAPYHYESMRLIGLQNVEQISDRPFEDNLAELRYLKKKWPSKVLIASIMGFSREEWHDLAVACQDAGADMLELNFSCPHMTVEGSGMKVSQAFPLVEEYTSIVKKAVSIPVMAKLTPNITDITEPALFAKQGGADALSAINTVSGLVGIDLDSCVPIPNVFGKGAMSGYSGPGVKPIGLRCIAQLAQCDRLGLPLSGIGGIETWINTLEYILCGATTVQITTGVIHYGYRIVEDILDGLMWYLKDRGITSIASLVGKALSNIVTTDKFDLSRQGIASYDLDRCIGCGQCYIVCQDAGGQCLSWDSSTRRPVMDRDKCLGCMVCSFVCPIGNPPLITYQEVPGKPPVVPPVSVF